MKKSQSMILLPFSLFFFSERPEFINERPCLFSPSISGYPRIFFIKIHHLVLPRRRRNIFFLSFFWCFFFFAFLFLIHLDVISFFFDSGWRKRRFKKMRNDGDTVPVAQSGRMIFFVLPSNKMVQSLHVNPFKSPR